MISKLLLSPALSAVTLDVVTEFPARMFVRLLSLLWSNRSELRRKQKKFFVASGELRFKFAHEQTSNVFEFKCYPILYARILRSCDGISYAKPFRRLEGAQNSLFVLCMWNLRIVQTSFQWFWVMISILCSFSENFSAEIVYDLY